MRGVDVHAHFAPRHWLDRIADGEWRGTAALDGDAVVVGADSIRLSPAFTDLAAATAGLRLRVFAIPPPLMAYDAPVDVAVGYCSAFNDALVAETAGVDAAVALATLPMQDAEAAADELRRARAAGCVGAQIGAHVAGRSLGSPELRPVLRAAQETGALLVVHPYGPAEEPLRHHHLQALVAWPLQTTVAGVSLIFEGALAELEELKVVLVHGGGTLPFLLARLDRGYEMRAEVREGLPLSPSASASRLFYDTVLYGGEELRFLVRAVGASQVVLGSDYPFPMALTDPVASLEAAELDAGDALLVAEANALGLLDLDLIS